MPFCSVVSRRAWGSLGVLSPVSPRSLRGGHDGGKGSHSSHKIFPKMVIASGIKIDSLDEDISKYLIFLNKRMSHGSRYKMAGYRPTYNTI